MSNRLFLIVLEPAGSLHPGCAVAAVFLGPPFAYYVLVAGMLDWVFDRDISPFVGDIFWAGVGFWLFIGISVLLGKLWRPLGVAGVIVTLYLAGESTLQIYRATRTRADIAAEKTRAAHVATMRHNQERAVILESVRRGTLGFDGPRAGSARNRLRWTPQAFYHWTFTVTFPVPTQQIVVPLTYRVIGPNGDVIRSGQKQTGFGPSDGAPGSSAVHQATQTIADYQSPFRYLGEYSVELYLERELIARDTFIVTQDGT